MGILALGQVMATKRGSEQPPDSPENLRAHLRDTARPMLLERLEPRLDFAKAADVAELFLAQMKHSALANGNVDALWKELPKDPLEYPDWLQTQAASMVGEHWDETAIEDCDQVAESLSS